MPQDREDSQSVWEAAAERAVDEALDNADFDDIRGVISVDDGWEKGGSIEFDDWEDLQQHLIEVYDNEWTATVPFDGGEAVFTGDAMGYVGDQIADRNIEQFFDEIRPPDDGEELVESRDLVEDAERSRVLRVDFQEISGELIRYLAAHPHYMRTLDPRKFEELIAKLFEDKGYTVELTPRTRDGGLDIIAIEKADVGTAMTLIECKRYAQKKVGVEVVRGLYGVVEEQKATRGLVATTSFFTSDAVAFRDKLQYRLSLADFDRVTQFLRGWRAP